MARFQSIIAQFPAADPRSIRQVEQEICDELEFHLEMRTEENILSGMTADEARAAALARFGDFESIRRSCRRTLLGERIMFHRLQMALTIVLFLVIAGFGYTTFLFQRANHEEVASLIAQLEQLHKINTNNLNQATARLEGRLESIERDRTGPPAAWEADRPCVVETFPAGGADEVDPATNEIRVTFNKPMSDGSWSWVRSMREEFPEANGQVHYLEGDKICVMPVTLKPGTKYVVWFNSGNYQNFKDREGRPAVPHLLTFTTRK